MSKMKKIWATIIIVLFNLIIIFVLCEGVLRIWQPFEMRVKYNKIILPVNKQYIIRNLEAAKLDKVIIHTKNSIGFRGSEPPNDFSDYLTMVAIGGSTTECFYLSDGKTWEDRLADKLRKDFNKVWINNAGLEGHTTFGHLILLQDYVVKLRPKFILLLIGLNDTYRDKLSDWDKKNIQECTIEPTKGLLNSLAAYSEVLNLYNYVRNYYRTKAAGLSHSIILFDRSEPIKNRIFNKQFDLKKLEAYNPQTVTRNPHNTFIMRGILDSYEKNIVKIIDTARHNLIEPIFITQPVLYGNVIDDVSGVDLANISVDGMSGSMAWEKLEMYNDVLRKIREEYKVHVIDLARKLPKSSKYFYDLYHYNNKGAEEVANILYKELKPVLSKTN
jgi:lysophospholipase L1-like esterase